MPNPNTNSTLPPSPTTLTTGATILGAGVSVSAIDTVAEYFFSLLHVPTNVADALVACAFAAAGIFYHRKATGTLVSASQPTSSGLPPNPPQPLSQ